MGIVTLGRSMKAPSAVRFFFPSAVQTLWINPRGQRKHRESYCLVAEHIQYKHSLIERCIIKDIYTPRDYIVIFETARMHPSPYKVTKLYHNDFMKLPGAYVANIRPGKKVGDPTDLDLRTLQYKLDFESDWEDLPQWISIPKEPSQRKNLLLKACSFMAMEL